MALYTKRIFVPAGNPESSPITTNFTIRENVITRIDVMIDTVATKGLVGVKIAVGRPGFKVFAFPRDSEDWIRKAETYIENINLLEPNLPASILVAGEGTTKNHTVIVSIHTASSS